MRRATHAGWTEEAEGTRRLATSLQRARRVETANLKSRSGLPPNQDFPTLPLNGSDLIERNRDPPRAAAGQECVEPRDLELAHMSWAVALSPPNGIATSTHGRKMSAPGLRCIRS